jgi:hypothetical protein
MEELWGCTPAPHFQTNKAAIQETNNDQGIETFSPFPAKS